MRVLQVLRRLSLPAAVSLGGAVAVGCGEQTPTAPDQSEAAPSFIRKHGGGSGRKLDDVNNSCETLPTGYVLVQVNPGAGADDDGDGLICQFRN